MPATATKPITFIARAADIRLVILAEDVERNHRGQIVKTFPGSAVEFKQHRFITDPDAEIRTGEDEDGKPVTEPVVDVLRRHDRFNVDFWEVGNAPGEPQPTFAEQNAAIIRALAERDPEAIYAVVEAERETHKRDNVFEAAEQALAALAGDSEDSPDDA